MAKVALVETKPSRTDYRKEFDGAFEFDQYLSIFNNINILKLSSQILYLQNIASLNFF